MMEEMQAETVSEADTIRRLTDALLKRERNLRQGATRRLGGPKSWVVHRFDHLGSPLHASFTWASFGQGFSHDDRTLHMSFSHHHFMTFSHHHCMNWFAYGRVISVPNMIPIHEWSCKFCPTR